MSSSSYPLRTSGIYRNLPTFDPEIKGLKAVVCGATGISGFHTLRALLDTPDRWSTVYAISRRPLSEALLSFFTPEQRSRIHHIAVDLAKSAEEIATRLHNVSADYIFYYAYLPPKSGDSAMNPSTAEDLIKSNVPPFKNFLDSLHMAGIRPKRILLQTGGKNYGVHIGRVRTPLVESDPQPQHLEPNFYYRQEELLFAYCSAHEETCWNIVMPAAIIGATEHPSMNTFVSYSVYAAVKAYKGEMLEYGAGMESWQFEALHASARLTGYLSEWAVLEDKCRNERFNAGDGGMLSFDRFYEELARWYGVEGVRRPEVDEGKLKVLEMKGGEEAPLGYGPPLSIKQSFRFVDWAKNEKNQKVWKELMEKSDGQLKKNVFEGSLDEFIMGDFNNLPFGSLSMSKARILGFCGIFEMYQDMAKLGLLVPMKVEAARPLI
ncbi:NAD(P)-binding protein [Corynespora cassiicola Philippines]|uniref:NAD(P)-binding protein n=1 Tax=Corynespora cassiicola Philippines TaxID=1448308 RepID=A0A2T2N726_CORCC|nr:NAD(P)-binding protein [Corynespora cassiicola Philippines]